MEDELFREQVKHYQQNGRLSKALLPSVSAAAPQCSVNASGKGPPSSEASRKQILVHMAADACALAFLCGTSQAIYSRWACGPRPPMPVQRALLLLGPPDLPPRPRSPSARLELSEPSHRHTGRPCSSSPLCTTLLWRNALPRIWIVCVCVLGWAKKLPYVTRPCLA